MDTKQPTVEIRHTNVLFKCILEDKWYNGIDVKAYSILVETGVMQQQNNMLIQMGSGLICESCWLVNKDPNLLNFKEPSKIIPASPDALNHLKKPDWGKLKN